MGILKQNLKKYVFQLSYWLNCNMEHAEKYTHLWGRLGVLFRTAINDSVSKGMFIVKTNKWKG